MKKFNVRDVAYAWVDREPTANMNTSATTQSGGRQNKILQASFTMEGGKFLDELVATLISKFGKTGSDWADYNGVNDGNVKTVCKMKGCTAVAAARGVCTDHMEEPLKVWVMDLQWKYPTKENNDPADGRRVRFFAF